MPGAVGEEQLFAWQIGTAALTVSYSVLNWNGAAWDIEAVGNLTERADGLYEVKFTPDAAGFWLVLANYTAGAIRYDFGMAYFISWGVEQDNYAILSSVVFGLSALKDLIDAVQAEVGNLDGASMRGTDGAALAASWTAGLATILGNFTALRIGYLEELDFDLQAAIAAIQAEVDNLDGESMRGTDGAATAAIWTNALATILGNFTALRIGYLDELNFDLQGTLNALDGLLDGIIADIGVFPSANYATLAAYVEDIRSRLIVILADTNELQTDWADGGRLDLLLDAVKAKTDTIAWGDIAAIIADIGVFPTVNYATLAAYVEDIRTRLIAIVADTGAIAWGDITAIIADIGVFPTANYASLAIYVEDIRTRLIAIVGDTNEIQVSLADGGFTDLLIDGIKERTDNLPDDPADASVVAAAHALLATEAKQDIIDTNVDDLGLDVEEAHERAFLRRYPFVTTNESVANAAEVSLAAPAVVTPTFPTGATRLNSYVVAILKANNQSAAEHNIGVTLQKNIAAAGWVDVRDFTASPPLTLPEVDATGDSVTFIEPVSITTGQSVQFRFQVDSDNAGEVHYTQVFFFALEYDFQ